MEKIKQRKILLPEVQDMNLLNNFFKKLNNPVPAFVQTKLEKDGSNEPTLNSKPKTTFIFLRTDVTDYQLSELSQLPESGQCR